MIQAYLVLAHDAPEQLEALIERLVPDGTVDFVVLHIDQRSSLWRRDAHRIAARFDERVLLVEAPAAVRWGHRSQLRATRKLLDHALTRPFDVAHLISGRDWPVAPRATRLAELAADPARCLIETRRVEQQERMQHWWLHAHLLDPRIDGSARYRATKKLLRIASRWLTRLVPRTNPYGGPWRKGSQWWSLPRDACVRVATELARLDRRTRFTACSDEHVIQTIVAHAFPDRLADPRRYTDWSTGASSPKTLRADDRDAIVASGSWFARKVDAATDDWFVHALPSDP